LLSFHYFYAQQHKAYAIAHICHVQQVILNTDKCKVISIHQQFINKDTQISVWNHIVLNNNSLQEVAEIKDLGVYYDSLLLFDNHVSEKVKSLHDAGQLGVIKRNFIYISIFSKMMTMMLSIISR